MILNDFSVPSPSFMYETTYYRALVDDAANTEYVKGDILLLSEQVDEATLLPTGVVKWKNVDTGVAITLPFAGTVGTDVEALDNKRVSLSPAETLVVSSTAVSLGAVPAGANHAEVHVLDAAIILTYDGATAPVGNGAAAPIGIRQGNGQVFELESADEIANFSAMRLDGATDARIYVEYTCQFDFND